MNKELIDHVWKHCLPKEFKEAVKNYYEHTDSCSREEDVLESIFGEHNLLTSDAEGEEMLYVSRKRVQSIYKESKHIVSNEVYGSKRYSMHIQTLCVLESLFGSKCLPEEKDDCQKFTKRLDDTLEGDIKEPFKEWYDKKYSNVENLEKNGEVEPKAAEPKFKVGDKIRIVKGGVFYDRIGAVTDIDFVGHLVHYKTDRSYEWLKESDLEPYTEPEEEVSKMKPIESKVRVYLVTKEEDEEFRQLLHKNGFEWNTGESLIDNSVWSFDKEESKIHNIYPNKIVTYSGDITPNILSFYKFKKQYFEENVNLSQETANCDKHFDNILKDSFAKERRLNIAAMIIQGIMANPNPQMVEMDVHRVADLAILMTDTLIAEVGKGDKK